MLVVSQTWLRWSWTPKKILKMCPRWKVLMTERDLFGATKCGIKQAFSFPCQAERYKWETTWHGGKISLRIVPWRFRIPEYSKRTRCVIWSDTWSFQARTREFSEVISCHYIFKHLWARKTWRASRIFKSVLWCRCDVFIKRPELYLLVIWYSRCIQKKPELYILVIGYSKCISSIPWNISDYISYWGDFWSNI